MITSCAGITKPFLRKCYEFYYEFYRGVLSQEDIRDGINIEVGSGVGFAKELFPSLRTSDLSYSSHLDIVFDTTRMPFRSESISSIVMLDVLHHVNDPESFFEEAQRCLKKKGRILMVEPNVSFLSAIGYRIFHHEAFDARGQDWKNVPGGNLALSWIILVRDRQRFEARFPSLKVADIRLHTTVMHLLSGGLHRRFSFPPVFFPAVMRFEKMVSPLAKHLATMMTVELVKQ